MEPEEPFADEHEFCCKNPRTNCPRASLQSDGAVLSAPRAEALESAERVGIKWDRQQLRDLYKWLKDKGFDR